MTWRFWNKIFGWDYIAYTWGISTHIGKVYKTGIEGLEYVKIEGSMFILCDDGILRDTNNYYVERPYTRLTRKSCAHPSPTDLSAAKRPNV